MKKLTYFATTVLAAAMSFGLAYGAVASGSQAPDFKLKDTQGNEHSLSDFKGKYVVLEWTNADCPFVKKHYDNNDMQNLQKEMAGEDVVWLQIVSSAEGKQGHVTPEQGEKLRKDKNMNSTAMLLDTDGTVGKMYAAKTTPHMYLIDPQGVLVYQGAIDSISSANPADVKKADNYLKTAYTQSKAGEKVANDSTKPYGCGVKY